MRNGAIRKKFDSLKYTLRKMEVHSSADAVNVNWGLEVTWFLDQSCAVCRPFFMSSPWQNQAHLCDLMDGLTYRCAKILLPDVSLV